MVTPELISSDDRFCTKQGVHSLPPIVTRFPPATYHFPSFSNGSETHFIRVPMPLCKNPTIKSIHTHQFDPFLEISHKCTLMVHFNKITNLVLEPVTMEFPIIITDYPAIVSDSILSLASSSRVISTETEALSRTSISTISAGGGDDAVGVDLDLPEYTPRYEESSSSSPPIVMTN
jgi:hypothetical protein